MQSHPLVRAASLKNYPEIARSHGLDPARMMVDAGLSTSVLDEPDQMIPADRVGQLLETSAQRSGDESFGLRMAETRHLSNLGPVGLVIRDQPTLRDSLSVLVRYHAALNGSLAVMIEEAAGVVVIREEVLVGGHVGVRQATELAIGVMLRLMRQVLGEQWHPRRVCFMHAAPRDTRTHLRVFGPCVEFNHDFNGIVCSRAELDTTNPSADPAMARYAIRLLESSMPPPSASMLDDVRRTVLLLLPSGRCSIEQVANHLGVVCRTVQRRLSEQGLSFSEVVNAQRLELATRYVKQSDRPLTDVAALLGFAASSGFSRWYQGQFGCSPSQSRAEARGRAVPLKP
jgi:AraC-like DNA-binding protein